MVRIETERLLIIALSRAQLSMALRAPQDLEEALQVHVSPGVFSDESRQAMTIKLSRMDHVDPKMHPWYTYFLIVRSNDRQAVGVCGCKGAPSAMGTVEIGYAMHPDYRNMGYMTETVRALIAWAFTHDICKSVVAETLRHNIPSQRVLQKAGMKLERAGENMLLWKVEKQVEGSVLKDGIAAS